MNITDFNYRIDKENNSRMSISSPIFFGRHLAGKGEGINCKMGINSLPPKQQDLVSDISSIYNIVGVFVQDSKIILFKNKHIAWDAITQHLGLVLGKWIEKNIISGGSER